jgi:DNA-binding CsgD family transcriptional regulator
LHARDDAVIPVAEGRLLASGIPDAEFVELDSRNHILLEHEPAWHRFQDAVLAFLPPGQSRGHTVFASLSARERQVLALMADGLSNTDIAERLGISEKTVRNHSSNLFDKLGVWSRARAIVFARDHGSAAEASRLLLFTARKLHVVSLPKSGAVVDLRAAMRWLEAARSRGRAQGAHEHDTKEHDLPVVQQGR